MAYKVKYRGEWRATTRGVRNYVVDILERDYVGNISPIYLTGDCATITYGEVDQSELMPIKSSEAEITLLCRDDGNPYEEFFTLDSSKYQVVITEDEVEIWRGYLATGSYQQPLAKAPYVVRLRANDGLAILKSMPYLDGDGNKHQDTLSISALINRVMSPLTNGVEIWSYPLIYFGQTSSTFDIVGISSNSLYKVFGDKVPTYYDVLEEALKNFGVQLFQYEGRWRCRSLSMLINAYTSNLAYLTTLDQPSSDGYGMKSNATLTFSSPLRKMTYTNSESNEVDISDVVSNSSNWRTSSVTADGLPFASPYGKAIRIGFPGVVGTVNAMPISSASLVFPQVINRSATTKMTISADIAQAYNTSEGIDYYLGVWLVDAASSGDVVEWGVSDTNPFVRFLRKAYYWNGSSEKWVKLAGKANPTLADIGLTTFKLEKLPTDVARPSLAALPTVNATFELPNIPTIEVDDTYIERWQIALVVAGVASASTGALPKMRQAYIFNPKITISHIDGVAPADGGEVTISADGISDEAYQPKWITATESLSVADFMPALIDLSNGGRQVYGYLEASQGIADKDVVAKMLCDLRARPTRVIEGEVDKPLPAGLNTIAKYDNRNYYISYIRKHLNRGVSTIQMRELLALNEREGSATLVYQTSVKSELFALDKSVYWLSNSKLCRRDVTTGAVTVIKDITSSAKLSRGVQCVILSDTTYVEAYDDNGERISQILNFASKNVTKDAFFASAKYDKIAEVWLAHNGDKVVVMCDKEGYEIGKWECKLPVPSTTTTDAEILPYNGGFIYRFYSTYSGGSTTVQPSYYSFWHSYAIHQAGAFEPLATYPYGYKNIRRISERFIIAIENGSYVIYHRNLVDMGISAPIKKTTLSSGYEVVDINNGVIVTRDSSGIAVYDTRSTSSSKYYRLSVGTSTSKVALCGDLVFSTSTSPTGLPLLQWVRVFPRLSSINSIAVSADE